MRSESADAGFELPSPPDLRAETGSGQTDADWFAFEVDVGTGEVGWQPDPGWAGWACASGADCAEGFCIQTPDGKQCTVHCLDECPFDWECVLHAPSLPDEVYICAPHFVSLCRPCLANADCHTNGLDTGEVCVDYGPAGLFCGAPCSDASACPQA